MPVDRYQTLTNYRHPQDSNLLDVHRAMEYNTLGQPVLRTTSGASPTSNDGFGRLRISQPFTLFDSFHRYQDNGRISMSIAGAATSIHDPNSSSILNTVTGQQGDHVYRESSRVFAYQPGKSLQILQTFCMAEPQAGLRQRYGFFDTSNGIYLEQDDGVYYFVRRSTSTGQIVNFRVPQSDWNVDSLDSTGTSTKTLDLTRAQIMFIDIEWLGVGSVRCGFVIDGEFVLAHIFHHANNVTTTYMGTACLPVRAEIENTATNNVASSLRIICTSVVSEGGYELRGRPRAVGHMLSAPYRMATPGTIYPLLSIRLKANRLGAVVIPQDYSVAVTAASNFRFLIIDKAITSGGTWVSAGTDSSVEYNLTATGYSNGTVVEEGYIIASNQAASTPSLQTIPFRYQLERNTFTNTAYEFVIACVSTGNNQDVFASVQWQEIT